MKHITRILAAAAVSLAAALPAYAETTLTVHYPMPGFFKNVMDTISKKFMEENPDIKIQFASPSATYEEGIQTILRQAGTDEMPDITFIGLNRLRMLDERNVAVDLGPLVKKEGNMAEAGLLRHDPEARPGQRQAGRPRLRDLQPDHVLQCRPGEGGRRRSGQSAQDLGRGHRARRQDQGARQRRRRHRLPLAGRRLDVLGAAVRRRRQDAERRRKQGRLQRAGRPEGGRAPRAHGEGGRHAGLHQAGAASRPSRPARSASNSRPPARWSTRSRMSATSSTLRTAKIPLIDPVNGHLPTGGNAVRHPDQGCRPSRRPPGSSSSSPPAPMALRSSCPAPAMFRTTNWPRNRRTISAISTRRTRCSRPGLSQMPLMVPWYAFPGTNGVKVTQTIVDNLSRIVDQSASAEGSAQRRGQRRRRHAAAQ